MKRELVPLTAPRFDGERFEEHTLPVNAMPGLKAYTELVLQIARKLVVQQDGSLRVPKGFDAAFDVRLAAVAEGSALLPLKLSDSEYASIFAQATSVIAEAIDSLNTQTELPAEFDLNSLSLLEKTGKALKPGDTLYLPHAGSTKESPFNAATIEALKQRRTKPRPERKTIEAALIGVNVEPRTASIKLPSGRSAKPRFDASIEASITAALSRRWYIRLRCEADTLVDSVGAVVDVSEILKATAWTRASEADVSALRARVATLHDGALQREFGLTDRHLQFAEGWFISLLAAHGVPRPALFPGHDGVMRAEWRAAPWDISVDVNLADRTAYLHAYDEARDEDAEESFETIGSVATMEQLARALGKYVQLNPEKTVSLP